MHLNDKRNSQFETIISLLLITLVTVVTYGFMIPKLGFYRDDWYMIWAAQAYGSEGIMDLFKSDRPFVGILYAFHYSFLGQSVINWHIYALFVKLIGGFSAYWLLRMLWPEKRYEATFAAMLFMIYPGFTQQPNAALFINLLLAHTTATLSLALTVYVERTEKLLKKIGAAIFSLVLTLFYLIIYEAMIGIEAVRIILVGYLVFQHIPVQKWGKGIWEILKRTFLYIFVASGFAYWRLFIFQSTRRATNVGVLVSEFKNSPIHGVLKILIEWFKDFFDISLFSWVVPLYQSISYGEYRDLGTSLLLVVAAVGLVVLFLVWTRKRWKNPIVSDKPTLHMIILGAMVILVTSLPLIVAGRDVSFSFQWDRYTVQSILGVALLITGIAFHSVRTPARWVLLLALVASGVMTQYFSAVYYRDFWKEEKSIWWQLSWRAPDLQPGTTIVAAPPPGFRFLEEYEVWGPLNIVYNPGGPLVVSGQVPYDGIHELVEIGEKEKRNMRNVEVHRDYSKTLVISKPTQNSCLHVINGNRLELPPNEDVRIIAIASYSRTDLIITDTTPKSPSADVFGKEPPKEWCYYYQKIELARQAEDWEKAAKLANEISRLGFTAADRSEWLPLIETYLNVGEMNKAKELAQYIKRDRSVHLAFCEQLAQTTVWPEATDAATLIEIVCDG